MPVFRATKRAGATAAEKRALQTERNRLLKARKVFEGMKGEIDGARNKLEELKKEAEKKDIMDNYGDVGDLATARIGQILGEDEDFSGKELMLSEEEMEKLVEKTRRIAAEAGDVDGRMALPILASVQTMNRKKLSARIMRFLKEKKHDKLKATYDYVRLAGMDEILMLEGRGRDETLSDGLTAGGAKAPVRAGGRAFGSRVKKKDIMESTDPKIAEFERIMNSDMGDKRKADLLTNMFVDSFPWYRKMRTEYLETFIKHQSRDDSYMVMTKKPEYGGIEKTNFFGTDLFEVRRDLKTWKLANEEMIDRGLIPGTALNIEQAKSTGAWISRPEAYWIPIKSRNRGRDREMAIIREQLSEGDRVMFGYVDDRTQTIVDDKRRGSEGGAWEKAWAAGLYDLGVLADRTRISTTQSWQTMKDLKTRYEEQELEYGGERIKFKALQDAYLGNVFSLQKRIADEENEQERKRLKRQLKKEMKEAKKKLRALYNYPLLGSDSTGRTLPENLDPTLGRLYKQLNQSIYEMAFLGIIPVRSGRHTSSGWGLGGYIGTYQAIGSPAIMEPRRLNWVRSEWSEADVIRSAFPAYGWQESIPVLRHLTYGNLIRTLSLPAIHINQPIAAASRRFGLIADGMPSQWEPQFPRAGHPYRAIGELALSIGHFVPSPLFLFSYPRYWLNPGREGFFSKRFRGLNKQKYKLYKAYSEMGGRSYALEGVTDRVGYKVGAYSRMMGAVDSIYTSTLAGAYPPVYYTDPYGRSNVFPWLAAASNRFAPGVMSERSERSIMSDIYRRDINAAEHVAKRRDMLKQFRQSAWGIIPATVPYNMARAAYHQVKWKMDKHKYDPIAHVHTCPVCGQRYYGSNHVCRTGPAPRRGRP